MRDRTPNLSRRSLLRGASAIGIGSTLPLSTTAAASQHRQRGTKPDMDEVDPVRYDYDDAIVEFERVGRGPDDLS